MLCQHRIIIKLHDYGGYCPSPLMFLASVAAVTKRIRLMTGCILPAFHHPIQIAAETGQLDAISHGRLDVGFARDYLPYEFAAFGVDIDSSRDRFEQTIHAVKKLWTEKNVTMTSSFFQFQQANSLPMPTQQPYPPIWGAAVNSRQSFAWLGEQGLGLLVTPPLHNWEDLVEKLAIYRESFVPNAVTKKPTIAISLPLLVRDTEVDAEKEGNQYLAEYLRVWANAADAWNDCTSNNYPGYTGMSFALRQNSPQNMKDTLQALIGTPQSVARNLQKLHKTTGIDRILWQVDFGGQSFQSSMTTLKLFIKEVLPLIADKRFYAII